ncbi:MAG: hypothetical protein KAY65_06780 [Planctomycetes bacterium]|nr:hypothetical protein [Planctomycetota bacterium]
MDAFNPSEFVDNILKCHKDKNVDPQIIWKAIRDSLSIRRLINNLAEAFRLPPDHIKDDFKNLGFSDLIIRDTLYNSAEKCLEEEKQSRLYICSDPNMPEPFPDLFRISAKPSFFDAVSVSNEHKELFSDLFQKHPAAFPNDPFVKLYREDVLGYFKNYMRFNDPQIAEYIAQRFNGGYPKYLVTTGIGANEQFNHFVASINNSNSDRRLTWLIINSPKRLSLLPDDATLENVLFMEFSRSSVTEETVKIHEYTPRKAHRIVFCNEGPLLALGQRDGNLIQSLPDKVAGRYGRNKTPILLAPMRVAGMDVEAFWRYIDLAINAFDIGEPNSLPTLIAKYIFLYQQQKPRNLIYLGCNDEKLVLLADEFVQFWNEGVNKEGNDLLISRFFGLPRDSHMNIEGILGNRDSKMAFFLLRTNMRSDTVRPLVSSMIDPISTEHEGLCFGDEEVILASANYKRFTHLMPTILIEIPCEPSLKHAAVIGQLFADITFIYSRFKSVNPGSNPEVKSVRERSAQLLSKVAEKIRGGYTIEEAIAD